MVSQKRRMEILTSPNMYPVLYDDKEMYKKDCDELFVALYSCKEALHDCGGVYLTDGMFIFPDGTIEEEDD